MANKPDSIRAVNRQLKNFRCLPSEGWLGGVCAGLAYRLGIATWVVRLAWFLTSWFYGAGILVYLLLWIFVPNGDVTEADYRERTGG